LAVKGTGVNIVCAVDTQIGVPATLNVDVKVNVVCCVIFDAVVLRVVEFVIVTEGLLPLSCNSSCDCYWCC